MIYHDLASPFWRLCIYPIRLSNILCAGVIASIPCPKLGKPGPGVPRCTDSTNPARPEHNQEIEDSQNWYSIYGKIGSKFKWSHSQARNWFRELTGSLFCTSQRLLSEYRFTAQVSAGGGPIVGLLTLSIVSTGTVSSSHIQSGGHRQFIFRHISQRK